jgi:hypothetical protein
MKLFASAKSTEIRKKKFRPAGKGAKVKNLLKFMSIGLVLSVVLFSQMAQSTTVEAADDVAENDIEFMTTHDSADATVLKHYKATSSDAAVSFYIRDADLNTVSSGQTSWGTCLGSIANTDTHLAAIAGRNPTAGSINYVIRNTDWTATNEAGTTASAGTGAEFTVAVAANGTVTIAQDTTGLLDLGCGFADNDVITIPNSKLGNNAGIADHTFKVNAIIGDPADAAAGQTFDNTSTFELNDNDLTATGVEGDVLRTGGAALAYSAGFKRETNRLYNGAITALVPNTISIRQNGASLATTALNENAGTFTLTADVAAAHTHDLVATYNFNNQQSYTALEAGSKRVHITSTSDSVGEWVEIKEVNAEGADDATLTYAAGASRGTDNGHIDSSVFRGTVNIKTDASAGTADNGSVWVQDGDTLTASFYKAKNSSTNVTGALIASTTATIDATAPTISAVTPADGTLISDKTPSLNFTIEDGGSGFDASVTKFSDHVTVKINGCVVPADDLGVLAHSTGSITVSYNAAIDWTTAATDGGVADANCETGAEVRDGGGYNVAGTAGPTALTNSTVHGSEFSWYIVATDEAGNAKTLGKNEHNDGVSDLSLRIDTKVPAATSVVGAKAWDPSTKAAATDNSSVQIIFDESLDASTVAISDFTVSGTGVTSSTIETLTMGGTAATTDTMVFLDLAADLGPNAKPKVKLVGEVQDRAGNKLKPATTETTGKTLGTAVDSVKPTLSDGAVGTALIVKDGESVFTFASNENLTKTGEAYGAAKGTYGSVSGGGGTSGTNGVVTVDMTGDAGNLAVTLSNPKSAKGTLKHATALNAVPMNKTGIYGIASVGRDAADNVGVGGITKVVEDVSASFTASNHLTTTNAADQVNIKLKNWPLADHDGDGSLQDSITAITVGGSTPTALNYVDGDHPTDGTRGGFRWDSNTSGTFTAADAVSAWISKINWSETEEVEFHGIDASGNLADIIIVAGNTVKVTYYYVNAEHVVELDLDAPTVSITPANLASVTDKTPSIAIAWDDDEYAGDSYTTVTMTKATLKGPSETVDVLADVTTTDNKTFYYVPLADLENGDYTLTVSAKDSGENETKDQTSKFTVKDRTKTTIAMVPGWNLISLPSEPTDSAIDTVITNSQVETVLTYDPSTPGGWLTAVRDGDTLVGTLSTIDASHAYWIFQNNGDDIKVDIPGYKGGASSVPPVISVVEGWNLVPAVTLTSATEWDADVYFNGLDWIKAKSWNASTEAWADHIPDLATDANRLVLDGNDTSNIDAGQGYWLYSNSAGVIVP